MPLDIYAHTQRRLSLNSCSQLLARQLSSLTSTRLYTRQVQLCLRWLVQARPGRAWSAPVSTWTCLDNVWPRLAKPVSTWTTSGPRLASAWNTHALPSVPRDPDRSRPVVPAGRDGFVKKY